MKEKFLILKQEHNRLLIEVSKERFIESRDLIIKFIARCVDASSDILDIRERIELSSILRHWGDLILNETGDYPDISLKEPRGRLSVSGLTWEDWESNCRRVASNFLQLKKQDFIYCSEWAIRRKDVEEQLAEFLISNSVAMVITGRIGVGKTFFICQLAEGQLLAPHKSLLMPFDCSSVVNTLYTISKEAITGLDAAIGQLIAHGLGFPDFPTFEAELERVQDALEERSSYLLFCFDGVERFRMPAIPDQKTGQQMAALGPRELLVSLNNIVLSLAKRKATRIKFLLTCVSSTWSWLGVDRFLSWNVYFTPDAKSRSCVLKEYSVAEFAEAYKKYEKAFSLPEIRAENDKIIEATDYNPYLIRLLADMMRTQGGTLPSASNLYRRFFYERVLRETREEQVEKDNYLVKFAEIADESDRVASRDADITSPAYKELILDGVLVIEKLRDPYPHISLTLDPPKLTNFIKKWYGQNREKQRN